MHHQPRPPSEPTLSHLPLFSTLCNPIIPPHVPLVLPWLFILLIAVSYLLLSYCFYEVSTRCYNWKACRVALQQVSIFMLLLCGIASETVKCGLVCSILRLEDLHICTLAVFCLHVTTLQQCLRSGEVKSCLLAAWPSLFQHPFLCWKRHPSINSEFRTLR